MILIIRDLEFVWQLHWRSKTSNLPSLGTSVQYFEYEKFFKIKQEVLSIPLLMNRFVNILTDFADAEIFLIDGDSLLLEIVGEKSLDWNNGGQFLHLTYLTERFLQKFTEKG